MGAFSDNKENCPVCEHVNERPLTESEPHAAALRENQALQATTIIRLVCRGQQKALVVTIIWKLWGFSFSEYSPR